MARTASPWTISVRPVAEPQGQKTRLARGCGRYPRGHEAIDGVEAQRLIIVRWEGEVGARRW